MAKYAVIGSGIAGSTCAIHLCQNVASPSDEVTLFSPCAILTIASNLRRVTRHLEKFELTSVSSLELPSSLTQSFKTPLRHVKSIVSRVNSTDKTVGVLDAGMEVIHGPFDKICICTGSVPRRLSNLVFVPEPCQPRILELRDLKSIETLQTNLASYKGRVMLLGNGGIALECLNAIRDREIIWVNRRDYVGDSFFDIETSKFFWDCKASAAAAVAVEEKAVNLQQEKTMCHEEDIVADQLEVSGPALGPHWFHVFNASLAEKPPPDRPPLLENITLETNATVTSVAFNSSGGQELSVTLSNGQTYSCDFLISAIGVLPASYICDDAIKKSEKDGGILVDENMETSVPGIYACGDVTTANFDDASPFWQQMRLWTQARIMALAAAQSMLNDGSKETNFSFEIFTHETEFFGFKVVFLGRYNEICEDDQVFVRQQSGHEFVRVVLDTFDRMKSAVLIGIVGLEETFENLILNGLNLSQVKHHLLDKDVDIEDYFD